MTPEDAAYAATLNLFGSDPEPPEIDALIKPLREDAVASHLGPNAVQVRHLRLEGLNDREIAEIVHMDRHEVGRIRRALGLSAAPAQPLTLEEKWWARTRRLPDGHLGWTGELAHGTRTPLLRYRGHAYTAARLAFKIHTGAWPTGYVRPGCGMEHCVEPSHMDDLQRRRRDRAALRLVMGMDPAPELCCRGHEQALFGKFTPNGVQYCGRCSAASKARRAGRVER